MYVDDVVLTQLLDDCKIMNLEIVTHLPIHLSRYYVDDVVLTPLLDNCLLVNMEIVTHLHIQLSGNVFDDVGDRLTQCCSNTTDG